MEKIGRALYESNLRLQKTLSRLKEYPITVQGIKTSYFYRKGTGDEAIIMLHGLGDSKDSFTMMKKYVDRSFHLFCPDLPGHGIAERRYDWGHHLDRFVSWVHDFIFKLGLKRVHVIGNSMGGTIACFMAIEYPNAVSSLSLLNPGGIHLPDQHSFYHSYEQGNNFFNIDSYEDWEHLMDLMVSRKFRLPQPLKNYLYLKAKEQNSWTQKIFHDLQNGIPNFDHPRADEILLNNHLHKIKQPTRVLWGRDDGVFPHTFSQLFADNIKGCKVHILNDVGHGPHVEAPLKTARIVNRFLREIRSH